MATQNKVAVVLSLALFLSAAHAADDDVPVRTPKYLELARELVATVTPENNKYDFKGPEGVRWKGDLFASENSVRTACGPFVAAVFDRAEDPTLKKVREVSRKNRSKYVRVTDWMDAAQNEIGLKKIGNLNDVQPGDLFIFSCFDRCGTSLGDVPGHISIVDVKPTVLLPQSPFVDGTRQWGVTVIDAADSAHDRNDTRFVRKGMPKITGVGRGSYRIYTDENGIPVGFTNGFGSKYNAVAVRPIVIARPITN